MAADCEIDGCGIGALGRCATCGRAFCLSHQGYFERPLADRCAPCQRAANAAAGPSYAQRTRSDEISMVFRIKATAAALDRAGRPGAVEAINWSFRHRRFLGTSWIEEPSGIFGWMVGMACWLESPRGEQSPRLRPTFVATDGTIYRRRPLDNDSDDSPHCQWDPEGRHNELDGRRYGVLPAFNKTRAESLRMIAGRLSEVAAEHNVTRPGGGSLPRGTVS
jgi:hypothetical protein